MIKFLIGDCRETLKSLPAQSVQCVVTSPPYYGLRDYGEASQIGLESTPEVYIAKIVEVFREVRRVLRDDGTLWLNIGDSYAGSWGAQSRDRYVESNDPSWHGSQIRNHPKRASHTGSIRAAGVKAKDLYGIPWMLAFALRADGWYLRQDIIWNKPNPMPESTRDRCTKAHEYLFLLTKRSTYYFDHEAMKEPSTASHPAGNKKHKYVTEYETSNSDEHRTKAGLLKLSGVSWAMRNRRSVWTITTKPFKGAHFATFPPDLIEPCIAAGTSAGGCCATCGSPFVRQVAVGDTDVDHQRACGGAVDGSYDGQATKDYAAAKAQNPSDVKRRILLGMREKVTTGWTPTCACPPREPVPCVVLDPFGGAGTTGMVAQQHGRNAVLCELNEDYVDIARVRLGITLPFERAMLSMERAVDAAVAAR